MTMESHLIDIENDEIDDHATFEMVSSDIENNFSSINRQPSLPSLSPDGKWLFQIFPIGLLRYLAWYGKKAWAASG